MRLLDTNLIQADMLYAVKYFSTYIKFLFVFGEIISTKRHAQASIFLSPLDLYTLAKYSFWMFS